MKTYSKPQMMAKNAPTGSYAAGCPRKDQNSGFPLYWPTCDKCERSS